MDEKKLTKLLKQHFPSKKDYGLLRKDFGDFRKEQNSLREDFEDFRDFVSKNVVTKNRIKKRIWRL